MGRVYLVNDPFLKKRRSELRKNQTFAERLIWRRLRNRQIKEVKFFRQYSIGSYVVDFYSPKQRLAIEIDGGQHNKDNIRQYDLQRTNYLNEQGIKVLRFWNNEVLNNIEGVLEVIYANVNKQ